MSIPSVVAIVVTLIGGWALIKRYQSNMVLLGAGLIMIIASIVLGDVSNVLPKGAKSSGLIWFDIIDLMRVITAKQASGIGLIIMVAGGFASYMNQIGASDALVRVCTAPLRVIKSPYIVLSLAYMLGQMLFVVIPSAAGLAMLLLVLVYPILIGLGVSRAAAAAAIATTGGMAMGPAAGTAILAARTANLDPIIYFVKFQIPVGVPIMLTVAVLHFFVQRYLDKKDADIYETVEETKKEIKDSPGWYAIFPVLPVILLIYFSNLGHGSINLHTITALFLVWLGSVIVELIRMRSVNKVFKDATAMFKGMGSMMTSIVMLIVAAEMFANGLIMSGLIDSIIKGSQGVGLGMKAMTTLLTFIVGLVTFLTGSGVGAYTSFASLCTTVAPALGGTVEMMITPMQFAAGMFRAISPVAGVIIAVAAAVGMSPLGVVRRTFIPIAGGIVTMMVANFLLLQ